jgi:hypothetical protein
MEQSNSGRRVVVVEDFVGLGIDGFRIRYSPST